MKDGLIVLVIMIAIALVVILLVMSATSWQPANGTGWILAIIIVMGAIFLIGL